MKNLIYLLLSVLLVSCSANEVKVQVENPSDFDRIDEMVEIPIESFKSKILLGDNQTYMVKNNQGENIPSQITSDGLLIFQSGLKAKEQADFTILAGEKTEYTAKTYGRFITERKDDFAWENDRVAFRVYGPALIATDGPSNGMDVWFKRTNNLVIDKWYKDDLAGVASYHDDHGEGLDDYKVGRSLGAGSMAPYVNDTLWLNENFVSQEIMDNGPLRTTVKMTNKNIKVADHEYADSRIFSIDAGSQLTKVIQTYDGVATEMPVAVGFVKRENDSIITSTENNYIVYAEPSSEKAGDVYLAMVFPKGFSKSAIDTYTIYNEKQKKEQTFSHVLGVTNYQPNTPIAYYVGYGWNRFGFPSVSDFEKYVQQFSASLKQPLIVKY